MTEIPDPVCEVCGASVTHTVADVYVNENWDTGMRELTQAGVHFFCSEHVRESEMFDITESPLTYFYKKLKR